MRHKAGGTHFEPQRASVRAGRSGITCKSGPHASALRLKIYKVSAIGHKAGGMIHATYRPEKRVAIALSSLAVAGPS